MGGGKRFLTPTPPNRCLSRVSYCFVPLADTASLPWAPERSGVKRGS